MPTASSLGRPVELLLVEDSPSDAGLMRVALASAAVRINVHLVQDGEEALRFLRRGKGYASAPRPDLVLLDLNMPKVDGREVLAEIRSDQALESIPVIVLTTSAAPEDVARVYKLKANCYVQKPVDLDEFMDAIKSLEAFWFTHATLPSADV
jgi:two-component system, chemotaxis family, response regulator Rcp1